MRHDVIGSGDAVKNSFAAGGPGQRATFVFDPVAINTLKAKGLTFEAAYVNNRWVGAA